MRPFMGHASKQSGPMLISCLASIKFGGIRSVARRVFACRRKRKRGARPVAFRPSQSPVQGRSERNFVSRRPGSGGTIAVRLPPNSFSFFLLYCLSLFAYSKTIFRDSCDVPRSAVPLVHFCSLANFGSIRHGTRRRSVAVAYLGSLLSRNPLAK